MRKRSKEEQNVPGAFDFGSGRPFLPLTLPCCNFVHLLAVRLSETWLVAVNYFISRKFGAEVYYHSA